MPQKTSFLNFSSKQKVNTFDTKEESYFTEKFAKFFLKKCQLLQTQFSLNYAKIIQNVYREHET